MRIHGACYLKMILIDDTNKDVNEKLEVWRCTLESKSNYMSGSKAE